MYSAFRVPVVEHLGAEIRLARNALEVLEELLSAQVAPRPVRVHNAGVVSYGQHEELATLRALLPDLRPDLVVLQFTAANDVVDDQRWLDQSPLVVDPEGAAVALLSHDLFERRWGGDPAVVGSTVPLDGRRHRIVGVLPRILWQS